MRDALNRFLGHFVGVSVHLLALLLSAALLPLTTSERVLLSRLLRLLTRFAFTPSLATLSTLAALLAFLGTTLATLLLAMAANTRGWSMPIMRTRRVREWVLAGRRGLKMCSLTSWVLLRLLRFSISLLRMGSRMCSSTLTTLLG